MEAKCEDIYYMMCEEFISERVGLDPNPKMVKHLAEYISEACEKNDATATISIVD